MNPLKDFSLFWKNYANFTGRTPRRGFWYPMLFIALIYLVFTIVLVIVAMLGAASAMSASTQDVWGMLLGSSQYNKQVEGVFAVLAIFLLLFLLFTLGILVPTLSLCVRRLHDTGRRWHMLLILCVPTAVALVVELVLIFAAQGARTASDLYAIQAWIDGFSALMAVVELAVLIGWIIIMAQPSSPQGFGASTHEGLHHSSGQAAAAQAVVQAAEPLGASAPAHAPASPYYQPGIITGIAGMYSGAQFPLHPSEMMVLGRDAALSHIVIDQGAAKVSRKHVSLVFDQRQKLYYAHDYSTNGTYKDDGTRLPVDTDVALPAGTVISLGSAGNSFKLG